MLSLHGVSARISLGRKGNPMGKWENPKIGHNEFFVYTDDLIRPKVMYLFLSKSRHTVWQLSCNGMYGGVPTEK
jgi:hypothetical protein